MALRNGLLALAFVAHLAVDPAGPSPLREGLPELALPPRPAEIPKYTELDPATGLHMTGTPQFLKAVTYRLKVSGKVDHPLRLTYDELRRMPRITSQDPLICKGYFEDYAHWAGASLQAVLDQAGLQKNARNLTLLSADGYSTEVTLAQAGNAFLAYEWEGKALPELHGYPVRAVFPGSPGYNWVKWLVEIRVQ
jgi:DMSO/TMAO reductase YedYZ molybdopterin-dependent catalytic subunit